MKTRKKLVKAKTGTSVKNGCPPGQCGTPPDCYPCKQVSGIYDFKNIYTGPDSTHPGVLKAQADKKKAEANLLAYKKKVQAQKQLALEKAKTKNNWGSVKTAVKKVLSGKSGKN